MMTYDGGPPKGILDHSNILIFICLKRINIILDFLHMKRSNAIIGNQSILCQWWVKEDILVELAL